MPARSAPSPAQGNHGCTRPPAIRSRRRPVVSRRCPTAAPPVQKRRSSSGFMPRSWWYVDLDPTEATRLGEHLRLRLDHLRDEHPRMSPSDESSFGRSMYRVNCSTPSISPRRFTSTATTVSDSSRRTRSIEPIAVGYSRRTSVRPTSITCAARRQRTPGDGPRRRPSATPGRRQLLRHVAQHLVQCDRRASPASDSSPPTGHRCRRACSAAFIQFNGFCAPPSASIATQPSAFAMISRVAWGRWASSRPE